MTVDEANEVCEIRSYWLAIAHSPIGDRRQLMYVCTTTYKIQQCIQRLY